MGCGGAKTAGAPGQQRLPGPGASGWTELGQDRLPLGEDGRTRDQQEGAACPRPGWGGGEESPLPWLSGIPEGFSSSSVFLNCAFVITITAQSPRAGSFRAPAAVITLQPLISKKPREGICYSRSGRGCPAPPSRTACSRGSTCPAWAGGGPGAGLLPWPRLAWVARGVMLAGRWLTRWAKVVP